jgi:hypothetical protein
VQLLHFRAPLGFAESVKLRAKRAAEPATRMARNVLKLCRVTLDQKARSTMPMQNDRRKPSRARRYRSELDWFAEDPWAEPEQQASEDDWDEQIPNLWAWNEDDLDEGDWNERDEWNEEDHDGWAPIRPRRRPRHVR